ncbi:MAG: biotin--[acetyl-CoA-carboxylase] ligase [Halapricum sp.]
MQETRRAILDALDSGAVGGPDLAERLGCSRTAIWKHVETLRNAGFEIESTDDGYVLRSLPEFGGPAVEYGLDAPYEVEYHESIPSTNARARDRARAGDRDVVVLADEQTGGRGRLDRAWTSPSGGIWCSLLASPEYPPADAPIVTLSAAVAVVEAVGTVGVQAGIKWPNDVLVEVDGEERKLAGILTEMAGEHDQIDWVIVGIGLNANVDPEMLPEKATSLRALVGDVDRRAVTRSLLDGLHDALDEPETALDAWRDHSRTLGRRVRVETSQETIVGTAVDVTFPGTLVIETENGRRTVTAGDCEHLRPASEKA